MTLPDSLISPRLIALYDEMATIGSAALAAFWRDIGQTGTPLIEPLAGSADEALVTFLWRAAPTAGPVKLIRGLTQHDPNRSELFHLPQSDVWYRTFSARRDIRALYMVLPPDSPPQLDPLNGRTYHYPADEDQPDRPGFTVSVLEMPAAPDQSWLHAPPPARRGAVSKHIISSTGLDGERRAWVYTPPDYAAANGPYDLLVLVDGRAYAQTMKAPATLDYLIGAGTIAPTVAIMLDSPRRLADLLCNPAFADFLAHELLPWARQRYHLTADPARTIVGGMSAGGLAAAYANLRYPNLFGKVLAQSGAFWWRPADEQEPEWLARQFVSAPHRPAHFYLEVGRLEEWVEGDDGVSQLVSTRHLRDVLRARGCRVDYAEFGGDHDEICWQGGLANGLAALAANGYALTGP